MDTAQLRRRAEELLRAARAARCARQQAILVSHAAELFGFAQLEELGQPVPPENLRAPAP